MTTRFAAPTTVTAALADPGHGPGCPPRRGRHGPRGGGASGPDGASPNRSSRSIGSPSSGGRAPRRRARPGGAHDARLARRRPGCPCRLDRACGRAPRSWARRRRAGTGTIGGNMMNASPAAETTAPLRRAGRGGRCSAVRASASAGSRSRTWRPVPGRTSAAPGELLTAVERPAARARQRERLHAARVPARDGDRGRRRRGRSSRSTATARRRRAGSPSPRVAPTIVRRARPPRPRSRDARHREAARRPSPPAERRRRADRRRPRPAPTTAARCRGGHAPASGRGRGRPRPRRARPGPGRRARASAPGGLTDERLDTPASMACRYPRRASSRAGRS